MTRLARAGNGDPFTASGLIESTAAARAEEPFNVAPSIDPSASLPIPIPHRASISRRVRNKSCGRVGWCCFTSTPETKQNWSAKDAKEREEEETLFSCSSSRSFASFADKILLIH